MDKQLKEATSLYKQGKKAQAVLMLQKIVDEDYSNADAWYGLALALPKRELEKKIYCLTMATKADSSHERAKELLQKLTQKHERLIEREMQQKISVFEKSILTIAKLINLTDPWSGIVVGILAFIFIVLIVRVSMEIGVSLFKSELIGIAFSVVMVGGTIFAPLLYIIRKLDEYEANVRMKKDKITELVKEREEKIKEKKIAKEQELERKRKQKKNASELEEIINKQKKIEEELELEKERKLLKQKREIEHRKNVPTTFKFWNPEEWHDKTKSIYKILAKIKGRYNEIDGKWLQNTMEVYFTTEKEWGNDYYYAKIEFDVFSKISTTPNIFSYFVGEFIVKNEDGGKDKTAIAFFHNDDWYMTYKNISLEDAIVLIEATRLEKEEKFQRKIDQARNMVEGVKEKRHRKRIPEDVQTFVWRRDEGMCVKCGSNENLEFDHIIPFSKGGSDTARNIQLLCQKCNREKSNKI